MLEKKPEEIWPDWYLRDFAFDREKLTAVLTAQLRKIR